MQSSGTHARVLSLLATSLMTAAAVGQCVPAWNALPDSALSGVLGEVRAAVSWDPDGDGPQPSVLVVGGAFTHAGTIECSNLAAWDGDEWHAVGGGVAGPVHALLVKDGNLVVGGSFAAAGGGAVSPNIATWNGSAWSSIGTGTDGLVATIAAFEGDLIVGGLFTSAGGNPQSNIARWDGSTWTGFSTGMNLQVNALRAYEGNLYAGGRFTRAGGQTISRIAQWTGTTWVPLASGVNGPVNTMIVHDNRLVVGGDFGVSGNEAVGKHVAAWNGSAWESIGAGLDVPVFSLSSLNGKLIALAAAPGGVWQFDGSWTKKNSGRTSGSSWLASVVHQGELVIGGKMSVFNDIGIHNLARWDGAHWRSFDADRDGHVNAMATFRGELVAGGFFDTIGGVAGHGGIASWNGTAWNALGSGLEDGAGDVVYAMTEFEGDLVVGGSFRIAGGVPVSNLARWNGASWSAMGNGVSVLEGFGGSVRALTVYQGQLIAAGNFKYAGTTPTEGIAKWDGVDWVPFGPALNGEVRALAVYNDELIAAGSFTKAGDATVRRIAHWNGVEWALLGGGVNATGNVWALAVHDGALYAGGTFDKAGGVTALGIAKWDGTAWSAVGQGVSGSGSAVFSLHSSDGKLIVSGMFNKAGTIPARCIAAWTGSNWQPLGAGLDYAANVLWTHSNQLFAGGEFAMAGGEISPFLARWSCVCPADFDGTGFVDTDDFTAFVTAFEAGLDTADFDGTGFVDIDDFTAFIIAFEQGC